MPILFIFCLGGLAAHALTFAIDYRQRMRDQRYEALRNRILGGRYRKTMTLSGMRGRG